VKSGRITLIALLLRVITISVFAWFFFQSNTTEGTDGRTAIALNTGERELA
jgi:hypothetical protein